MPSPKTKKPHTCASIARGRVLVTGGAGFIGSALVWALNRRGVDNILVSDLLGETEKFRNLVPLRFVDYVEADTLRTLLRTRGKLLADVRTVFHLGARSATTDTDARRLIEDNYEYTKELGAWAAARGARFVYASSAATYGDGVQGMDDKDENLARLRPLNMYGYSKHLADLFFQRTRLLKKFAGLKYFNVFGPNEEHKRHLPGGDMRSVVHKAFEQIQAGGAVHLFKSYHPDYPDGGQKRDFLYVKDAVEMTLHLAENPAAAGLFNLGSGRAHTWLELVTPIFKALGKPPRIEFIEMPESLRAKYQYFTQADIGKLRATGFSASPTPLATAVEDCVRNYLSPGRKLGDEAVGP